MEKYKLTITRERQFLGAATVYTVVINGTITEKFPIGASRTYELDYAPTSIRFLIKSLGLTTMDQSISVDPTGYLDVTVVFGMPWKNQYSVQYDIKYGQQRSNGASTSSATPPRSYAPASNISSDGGSQGASADSRPGFGNRFCTECGAPIQTGYKFCGNCGHKL